MERLRQLIKYVNAQLGVLSVSQRVAIGLCAAMVAGSLLWLLQWSTQPEMESLRYEFTYKELDAAESALDEARIPYRTVNTRILVRSQDRYTATRILSSNDALPDGSLYDLAAAVSEQNPFVSPEARRYNENVALGNELAKIIASYPSVQQAAVLVNPRTKRRLGGASDVPTASVTVTLKGGDEMNRSRVEAFARTVSGAVSGLKAHNVNIMDARTGRFYSVPHPDDVGSVDMLALQKRYEQHLHEKILQRLAHIPGVLATVTVELDTDKRVSKTSTYGQPQEKTNTSKSSTTNSSTQPSESGVVANTGTALASGGQGQQQSTEDTTTENFPPNLELVESLEQMPGRRKSVTATVSIPRSFVVGVFQAKYPDTPNVKDDDQRFLDIRDPLVQGVKESVRLIVQAQVAEDVVVDVYPDMQWNADGSVWRSAPGEVVLATTDAGGIDAMGYFRTYGPQGGLGLLALFSLMMMMRIVRKSSQQLGLGDSSEDRSISLEGEPMLTISTHPVGQAGASESLLTGREVDEETLRNQELGSEVSRMVEGDPEGAAELVRRWIQDGA